jgi:hypothetical protein
LFQPTTQIFYEIKTDTYTPHALKGKIHSLRLDYDEDGDIHFDESLIYDDIEFNVEDNEVVLFDVQETKFWQNIPRSALEGLVKEDPRRYLTLERAIKYYSCRDESGKKAYLDTLGEEKKEGNV